MHLIDSVKRKLIQIKQRVELVYMSDKPKDDIIAFGVKTNSVQLSKWWHKGIPNIDDVMCGQTYPTSTVVKWFSIDSEEKFDNRSQVPSSRWDRTLSYYKDRSKWPFTKDNVNYTFNSLGYRGDDHNDEADYTVMLVSDSHGFGIGLDDQQTWAHQFKLLLRQQYPNCKIVNLSCPGASNDWIGRTVSCAIDVVKPDCVVVCYTYPNRREAIWDSGLCIQLGTVIPPNPVQAEYEEFQSWFMTINEHTDMYNMIKNQRLVEATCHSTLLVESHVTQMQSIQHGLGTVLGYTDVARDCQHFGPKVHKEYARKMYQKFCTLQNKQKKVK